MLDSVRGGMKMSNVNGYPETCTECGERRTCNELGECHECEQKMWEAADAALMERRHTEDAERDAACKQKSYDRAQRRAESGYAQ
jgi:hypothetical protein